MNTSVRVIVTLATAGSLLVASAGAAHAVAPISEATQVANIIADVAPIDVVTPKELVTGDLLAATETGTVDIPSDPGTPVVLSVAEDSASSLPPAAGVTVVSAPDIVVALPDLDGIEEAEVASDGTVSYRSDVDATVAVQPLADGARFLAVLESSDAPTTFDYALDLPDGTSINALADGSLEAVDIDGSIVTTVDSPWAFDASGASVPTHYEVTGTAITQVVDHTAGDYTYPITADPKITHTWWNQTLYFNKKETGQVAAGTAAASWISGYFGLPGKIISGALAGYAGAFGIYIANGKCGKLVLYPGMPVPIPQQYSGKEAKGYCK